MTRGIPARVWIELALLAAMVAVLGLPAPPAAAAGLAAQERVIAWVNGPDRAR